MPNSQSSELLQQPERNKSNHRIVIQGSPEWHDLRLGKVTASRIHGILRGKRGEYLSTRRQYMEALASERISRKKEELFVTQAMRDGIEREGPARQLYEIEQNTTVEICGFFNHPTIEMAGASPDGLLGQTGSLQIKCPTLKVHTLTLLDGEMPDKYYPQVQWEMECSHSTWCDFVSYHPDENELFIHRIKRDEKYITMLRKEVIQFLVEVDELVDLYRRNK